MKSSYGVEKINSGGQTGVDRAALDFAMERGFEVGGFVPQGRIAEDGTIPARYVNLVETESDDPSERTRLNIENSDATLIISRGPLGGGSALTFDIARSFEKPVIHIDLVDDQIVEAAREAQAWLDSRHCRRLNIAGPRASEDSEIYDLTLQLLREVFK